MRIGELGEQGLIKKISVLTGGTIEDGDVGIGDDAALTAVSPGKWLVTSKDLLVEDVHFLRSINPVDLGYKSLAVNLSDIAAMGANPRHAFVGLALPKDITVEYVLNFYRGMQELASQHHVSISGGDTVRSPGPLMISVTVQGEVDREQALLRSGATPGDLLCLTGPLGASAAGLLLLLHDDLDCPAQMRQAALSAHIRPVPRLDEARFLAASGAVTAAMDTSDGLLKDLSEICAGSHCGALLFADKIPVHPIASEIAPLRQIVPLEMALNGGEDYELLFTASAERFPALAAAYQQQFGIALCAFGEITRETGIVMSTNDGKRETIEFKGFQHF